MVFEIYYQNVRGLRTKVADVRSSINLCTYDAIVLTETWLTDSIKTEEMFSDAWAVWRRDRDYAARGQVRGGGVLVAVRREHAARARPEWYSTAEDLWVTIQFKATDTGPAFYLHVGCLYLIDQNLGLSMSEQLENFCDKFLSIAANHSNDKFIIMGDFNQNDLKWTTASDGLHLQPLAKLSNDSHHEILSLMNLNNLEQYNQVPNMYDGSILDLILSNDEVSVFRSQDTLSKEDVYHPALVCRPHFIQIKPLSPTTRLKFYYEKGDYSSICDELDKRDWDSLLDCNTVDEAVNLFIKIISDLRDKYIPSKTVGPSQYPVWFSPALIKIYKEKQKYHHKFKIYHNISDQNSFKVLRKRAQIVERECFCSYIGKIEDSIRVNPNAFWSYIRSNKQHNTYPTSMIYMGTTVDSGNDICNAFAEFFNSNYLQSSTSSASLPCLSDINTVADISSISVEPLDILKLLQALDCKKSAGPDGLHPLLLKKCSKSLTYPITLLFKKSLLDGSVPLIWKTATITPIHKKGSKQDISNYRPISKLCILAKVFEKLIHNQLYAALKHFFSSQQHGFMKGRSTTTNLVSFLDVVTAGMEGGGQVDAIYTDYSKAFDRIDHSILLDKLSSAGIRGNLLRWFTSYVNNRCQTVVLNGFSSASFPIPSGVPQGSILGPLLFNIFINDISQCFKYSRSQLFADDMKIYKLITNSQDTELLQADLNALHDYCVRNKLDLNISKCCCITFSRSTRFIKSEYKVNGQVLSRVNTVVDLGVTLDSKLLFDKHIESMVARAMKTLGFILRVSKDFKIIKTLKILYCALVRSQLEYCSQIWNPRYKEYITLIEKPQRKFLRFINYKANISNAKFDYDTSCKHHHLLPLHMRREAADLTFLLNVLSSKIDCSLILAELKIVTPSPTSRRNYLHFNIPRCHTNYRRNSYIPRTLTKFNKEYSQHVDLFYSKYNIFHNLINNQFFN